MNQSSWLSRFFHTVLVFSMITDTSLLADTRPTQKSTITRTQLQDSSVHILKLFDRLSAVIDTV